MDIRYWKSMEILNGKKIKKYLDRILLKAKFNIFALQYVCSVMQCVKLSFLIKYLEKWREVMVLNFFNLVLKRYWKSMENDF